MFFNRFDIAFKPVEKHFLRRSLLLALPSALMVVFSVLFIRLWGASHGWSAADMSTVSYYLLGSIGFLSVIRACLPLNIWRALLILFSVVGFYASAVVLKNLIEISLLTATTFPVYLALMAIFTGVFILTTILQKYEFD